VGVAAHSIGFFGTTWNITQKPVILEIQLYEAIAERIFVDSFGQKWCSSGHRTNIQLGFDKFGGAQAWSYFETRVTASSGMFVKISQGDNAKAIQQMQAAVDDALKKYQSLRHDDTTGN
jgi:hypothetical protein